MKKIIIFLLCGIFSFQLCGCTDQQSADERREQRIKEIEATFEDDGVLQYCYDEVTDSYHVCGIVATLPTDFYFPTQFNGKIVSETSIWCFQRWIMKINPFSQKASTQAQKQ